MDCYNIWEHTFGSDELDKEIIAAKFGRILFYDDIAGAPYSGLGDTICIAAIKDENAAHSDPATA